MKLMRQVCNQAMYNNEESCMHGGSSFTGRTPDPPYSLAWIPGILTNYEKTTKINEKR